MLDEFGCSRSRWRPIRSGAERDGRERILDLVSHLLRDLFPGKLALRAQQLSGVFNDEDGIPVWPRPVSDRGARW